MRRARVGARRPVAGGTGLALPGFRLDGALRPERARRSLDCQIFTDWHRIATDACPPADAGRAEGLAMSHAATGRHEPEQADPLPLRPAPATHQPRKGSCRSYASPVTVSCHQATGPRRLTRLAGGLGAVPAPRRGAVMRLRSNPRCGRGVAGARCGPAGSLSSQVEGGRDGRASARWIGCVVAIWSQALPVRRVVMAIARPSRRSA